MKFLDRIKAFLSRGNRYHLLSVMIIFFFSAVVTYTNLGLAKSFIGDDAGVIYHFPSTLWNLATSMWDSYNFPGRPNVMASIGLIHIGFINLLHLIGLTSLVVDRLVYFLFFFVSALGMYLLAYNLCSKISSASKNLIWVVSITGALFYILNNFTMILLSFPPTSYLYSYILLPWIFLLFYKNFHIDNLLWKRVVFALVFLLLLSGNPANTIGIVALLIFYDLFFKSEDRIIKNWKKFSATLFLILIFSSYIILPTIGNSGNPYGQVVGNDASITFNSSNTSISNLFRLKGHPAEDSYIFNQFLNSRKIILANFIILFLALGVLIKKRVSKIEIFLLVAFLLAIFLAKAEHPPLSIINAAIYSKVPLFEMFRASYYKFVIYCAFLLSLLLPLGILAIFNRISTLKISKAAKLAFLLLPIFLVLLSAKPFFSGDVANESHKVIIPVEYDQINKYFTAINEDFSVLSLPQLPGGVSMDWGDENTYGSGSSPDAFLLGRPTWTNNNFLTEDNQLNNFQQIKNNLSKTNTRYVLLHKDMTASFLADVDKKESYKNLEASILADSDFNLIESNKFFSVFEISKGDFTSHISIPADEIKALNFETKKINSAKYAVSIRNTSGTLPVIFAESFNKGWKAYLLDLSDGKNSPSDTWFKKSITEKNHILVNEYQNSWNINVDEICKDNPNCQKNSDGSYNFKLVIEFWPQRLFYLGLLIAIGGLIITTSFATIQILKKKKQ